MRSVATGIGITIICAAVFWHRPQPMVNLERRTLDLFAHWIGRGQPSGRVMIVEIDERSLLQHGRWPWPRERLAALINKVFQRGAEVVALDLLFPEPDDGDSALASAIQGKKVVVGYQLAFQPDAAEPVECRLQPPLFPEVTGVFRATAALCGRPEISAAAAATGYLNAAPDDDGLLRRVPLLADYRGRVYPSFALAAFLLSRPARVVAWQPALFGNQVLVLDKLRVPLDARAGLLVRFRGPSRTLPFVSAADVLAERAEAGVLRGKLVIVGGSAIGLQEMVSTPADRWFPGPEVQATVLDNLIQNDFLSPLPGGGLIEMLALLLGGLGATLLISFGGRRWASLCLAIVVALAWLGSFLLFFQTGSFVSPLAFTVVVGVTLGVLAPLRLLGEQKRVEETGRQLAATREFMIQSLASLAAIRDLETGEHLVRTQHYTRLLCEAAQSHPRFRDFLDSETVELLVQLVPLHDIGKVGVPDEVLQKPARLTPEEYEIVKLHVEHGRKALETARSRSGIQDRKLLRLAHEIVYTHHERWDGTGYPQKLAGDRIPIPGRMMALADVYDALVSKRVYKERMSHQEALAIIQAGSGTHFDPDLVSAFLSTHERWRQVAQEFDEDRRAGAAAAK